MNPYVILTDSACDIVPETLTLWGVKAISLTFRFNGEDKEYGNDDMPSGDFYDRMRAGGIAKTSAINSERFRVFFEDELKAGNDVLYLGFSSGLSTTYNSARLAADQLRETYPERTINVVDSLCAALGQGLLVWHAARKQKAGMSLADLTDWVENNKLNVCHWVTVDDLSHLKRGGRISATTAIVGTMLNIKPIIFVDNDGHLINTAKVRGRKAAMELLAKKLEETATDKETVFIGHGDCPEDAAALEAILKEKYGVKNVITGYVGPVIGAHTGPGVLVVFFMGTQR